MKNNALVHVFGRKLFVYNDMTFGEWLRKNLNARGVSNAEFARQVNVSPTYIGNLVRDYSPNITSTRGPRPGEPIVETMAKVLGVSLNEARLAAGYAPIGDGGEEGFFSGLDTLSPENQKIAKRQIRAIIDSFKDDDEFDTDYID